MGNTPEPINTKTIWRVAIAGAALAVVGIGSFIGLWILLGEAGFSDVPRLFASMCIPPALIAGIIGVYILVFNPHAQTDDDAD